MADAKDLKSFIRKGVRVRLPPPAQCLALCGVFSRKEGFVF